MCRILNKDEVNIETIKQNLNANFEIIEKLYSALKIPKNTWMCGGVISASLWPQYYPGLDTNEVELADIISTVSCQANHLNYLLSNLKET